MGLGTAILLIVVVVVGAILATAVFFPQIFNQGSKVCQQALSNISKDQNAQNICFKAPVNSVSNNNGGSSSSANTSQGAAKAGNVSGAVY